MSSTAPISARSAAASVSAGELQRRRRSRRSAAPSQRLASAAATTAMPPPCGVGCGVRGTRIRPRERIAHEQRPQRQDEAGAERDRGEQHDNEHPPRHFHGVPHWDLQSPPSNL